MGPHHRESRIFIPSFLHIEAHSKTPEEESEEHIEKVWKCHKDECVVEPSPVHGEQGEMAVGTER